MRRPGFIDEQRRAYPVRLASGLIVAQLLLIAAFRFWPVDRGALDDIVFDTQSQELIRMEEILPTSQQRRSPPPPAPLVPVIVPDDVVLTDVQLELTDMLDTQNPGEEDGEDDGPDAVRSGGLPAPSTGPRIFRFAEPEYTQAASREGIRAEVVVRVRVDDRGNVESAQVVERFLLGGPDGRQRDKVAALGYGLEESALAAARRCSFRPAKDAGRPVTSFTRITFTFGT